MWRLLIYGELRVGHEAVDGVLVLGFLNAFVEGAMEGFDHFDLHRWGGKKGGGENCKVRNQPAERGTGVFRRETKPPIQNMTA